MEIYAIAKNELVNYGRDSGKQLKICSIDVYGGEFHPTFSTKEKAKEYLRQLKFKSDLVIMPLELR